MSEHGAFHAPSPGGQAIYDTGYGRIYLTRPQKTFQHLDSLLKSAPECHNLVSHTCREPEKRLHLMLLLGEMHLREGNYLAADTLFRDVFSMASILGQEKLRLQALMNKGHLHLCMAEYQRARNTYGELLNEAGKENSLEELRVVAHLFAGMASESLYEPGPARTHYEQALNLATQAGMLLYADQADAFLGRMSFPETPLQELSETLPPPSMSRPYHFTDSRAMALHRIWSAGTSYLLGQTEKAREDFDAALSTGLKLGDHFILDQCQKFLDQLHITTVKDARQQLWMHKAYSTAITSLKRQPAYQRWRKIYYEQYSETTSALLESAGLATGGTAQRAETAPAWQPYTLYTLLMLLGLCLSGLFLLYAQGEKKAQKLKKLALIPQKAAHFQETQNRQLRQTNRFLYLKIQQLEQVLGEKERLWYTVIHDLRNALGKVWSLSDLLPSAGRITERQGQYLGLIKQASREGERLIEQLLNRQASEQDATAQRAERVNLQQMLEESLLPFREKAAQKSQQITYHNRLDDAELYVHRQSLLRIFENLLSNAIKFAPLGSVIEVESWDEGEELYFSVRDEGPGIAPQEQQRLFLPYVRLQARPTAGESSTGLGLSIVYELTQALGGKVRVESQVGCGTTFILGVPRQGVRAGHL
ncbi:MAG: hypothetical protein D6730_05945 [Bacteroidetes bacterium]|nr:MAG: hypothetical protein D6730_05945 [Bacteroidota bacterium]